jgi:hypothetical protein
MRLRSARREFMLGKEKTRETVQAVKYFKEALQHDPNYSLAYACLGFGYMFDYQNRWTEDPDGSLLIAKEYARQSIEKDPKEPLAHCVTAWCASLEKDLDRAATEIDTALSSIRIWPWAIVFAALFGSIPAGHSKPFLRSSRRCGSIPPQIHNSSTSSGWPIFWPGSMKRQRPCCGSGSS